MSHEKGLDRYLAFEELDQTLAKVGLIACVLLLGLRLFADQVLLVIIPVAGGAGLLLYLHLRPTNVQGTGTHGTHGNIHSPGPENTSHELPITGHGQQRYIDSRGIGPRSDTVQGLPTLPTSVAGYLPAGVFAAVAVLLLQVHLAGSRTTTTVLLSGAIGSMLLIQILFVGERHLSPAILLVQILLVTSVIRLTALFATPGFIGVDVWSHVPVLIQGIIDAGSLTAIASDKYVMAPIYHLVGAFGGLVFGSARTGTYLTLGLVLPLATLLVYVTSRTLMSVRWALLATTLFAFSEQFIRWGIHVIPTSLGLVFFLGALLSLTRLYRTDDGRYVVLLLVFSLGTVFTHQVSTVVVLVLLGAGAFAGLLDRFGAFGAVDSPYAGHVVLVFVFTVWTTLISWLLTPWSEDSIFLWRMLETLEAAFIGQVGFLNLASDAGLGGGAAGAPTTGYAGFFGQLVPVIAWLGFAILLAAMVVGALLLFKHDDSPSLRLTFILAVAVCFIVTFGVSLIGLRVLLPGRWMAFLTALLAIIGALGVAHIGRNATFPVAFAVFLTLALVFPMAMVVTEKATMDSPVLEQEYPRFAYTEAEISAVETIGTIQPPEHTGELGTDHPYQTLFERIGGYDTAPASIGPDGPVTEVVVYREYQSVAPTMLHEQGANETAPPIARNSQDFTGAEICPEDRNHPYANDEVTLCTQPPSDGDDE